MTEVASAATGSQPARPDAASGRGGWEGRRLDLLVGLLLLVAAAGRRMGSTPRDGLWYDDAWVATGAVHGGITELSMRGSAHPGFTLLLQAWDAVVGGDPWTLAVPAFVAGVLGPPVVYLGLRRLGFARSVALLLGSILVVADVHAMYAGRVKSYTVDTLVVMVLAVVLPSLAARRWTWRTAVVWVVAAVGVASLSGYQMVAAALAIGILVLHPNGDRGVRSVALAVQGVASAGMYLAARSTTDLDAIEEFMESTYDGHLSVHRNPITMIRQLSEHLGRIVDVYPGGPRSLLAPLGCLALAGLVAAATGWRRGQLAVTARFLLSAVAFAFVGGLFDRFPFGPTSRDLSAAVGSPGSRHSLWLVPVFVVGLAVCLEAARSWLAPRLGRRPVVDVALPVLAAVLLVVSWSPGAEYMDDHSLTATRVAERAAGSDGLILLVGTAPYGFAVATDRSMDLEPTPYSMVGFRPTGTDGDVVTLGVEWSDYDAPTVRQLASDRDRVVIVGSLLTADDPQVALSALAEDGFEITDTWWKGNSGVVVLDRAPPG